MIRTAESNKWSVTTLKIEDLWEEWFHVISNVKHFILYLLKHHITFFGALEINKNSSEICHISILNLPPVFYRKQKHFNDC